MFAGRLPLLATVLVLAATGTAASAVISAGASARGTAPATWLPATPAEWPLVVDQSVSPPKVLTHGVSHTNLTLDTVGGRQHGQVLDVNLADPNVRLGVVESHDRLTDPANEAVSSMAQRSGAVAGVNADFFAIYGTGRPTGMVIRDGRLDKTPDPERPSLGVRPDGSLVIGTETYDGTVTDGPASYRLTSVNVVEDLAAAGLTRITAALGATAISSATVAAGHMEGATLVIDKVDSAQTSLPQLADGMADLAGGGAAGTWLTSNVHPGDRVTMQETLRPDNGLVQAVSGGAILVHDGQIAVPLQGGGENNVSDPVTAVGVTRDGRHAVFAVFDGHAAESVATGLTRPQMATWLMARGVYNAILFDSGGSSDMVGRLPGQPMASVLNVPSDGHERPVANGLFIYSTETAPTRAVTASVNDGQPLVSLSGGAITVPAWSSDAAGNPATDQVRLTVEPKSLASVHGRELSGLRSGSGRLVVTAGRARASVALTVTDRLKSLTITPATPDLDNGAHQQFSASGTTSPGTAATLPTAALHWALDPATLGTIDTAGLLTTTPSGTGMLTVTATAGGVVGRASVSVGRTPKIVDPMTDVTRWTASLCGATGSVTASSDTPPGSISSGSLRMHYGFADTTGVQKVMITPTAPMTIGPDGTGRNPSSVGVWVKGNPDLATIGGGTNGAIVPGVPTLGEIYTQSSNQPITFWPAPITHDGWRLITASLPPGLSYPLTVNQLKLVILNAPRALSGDIEMADLQALYSPRPPAPDTYQAVPNNPRWLRYTTDPAAFGAGGKTLAVLDDAHLVAADPDTTGSLVMRRIAAQVAALPAWAHPDVVQALGDMSDTGSLANLQYAKSMLDSIGVPVRDAPGNHEITQGADPESGNFHQVFGDTHYSYPLGSAQVVVTDSAHTAILASDPYQAPAGDQYPWLVDQLTHSTAKTVILATHMPAYDPHPVANSQFADRWEARMYERLAAKYQASHPRTHVLLLFGHARGYAETLLAPDGAVDEHGLPNFVVADAGAQPYADPEHGGFYNYVLFHLNGNGDVQFTVEPIFDAITLHGPTSMPVRTRVAVTATATTPAGSDTSPISVAVRDPAARQWTTSNAEIASVDPVTGRVTAKAPGQAVISCTSGGATASITVTVTR